MDFLAIEIEEFDWRFHIIKYLQDSSQRIERLVRNQAINYVFMEEQLFRKTPEGIMLLCFRSFSKLESMKAMAEVHEEICGSHQSFR